MRFRPCIDIHDGKVKQIVGTSITDHGRDESHMSVNFVTDKGAAYYAKIYKRDGLTGGHVINLNDREDELYPASKEQAIEALKAYPGGLQYGGGVNVDNAHEFIEAGASHVIVTSYVFKNGHVDFEALERMKNAVGRQHLVLDLSCTRVDDRFYVVTDRWRKISKEVVSFGLLDKLVDYCDEFLIHAADMEGHQSGIDRDLVGFLGRYTRAPITYAGGVSDYGDIELISYLSDNNMDVTVGSCLDLFGGELSYDKIVSRIRK